MEKKAENLFRTYKLELIQKLGRKALSNDTIDTYGKLLFQTKYKGCYAQDENFQLKPGYYIINTDVEKNVGIHWISLILH